MCYEILNWRAISSGLHLASEWNEMQPWSLAAFPPGPASGVVQPSGFMSGEEHHASLSWAQILTLSSWEMSALHLTLLSLCFLAYKSTELPSCIVFRWKMWQGKADHTGPTPAENQSALSLTPQIRDPNISSTNTHGASPALWGLIFILTKPFQSFPKVSGNGGNQKNKFCQIF